MAGEGQKLRVGVIGCGGMGSGHLRCLQQNPDVEVAALADPYVPYRGKAAAQFAPNAPQFDDYRDLLADGSIKAVIIATPNYTHAEISIAALKAGKHVLCEKPMATTIRDCDRIIKTIRTSKRIWQVGLELRFSPVFRRTMELARDGKLGRVCLAWCHEFRGPFAKKVGDWIIQQELSGGALNEKDCHHFDLFNWVVDSKPVSVFCSGGQDAVYRNGGADMGIWKANKEAKTRASVLDNAWVIVNYANGVRACLGLCFFAPGVPLQFEVLCSDGRMTAKEHEGKVLTYRNRDGETAEYTFRTDAATSRLSHRGLVFYEQQAFLNSIRTGRPPLCDHNVGKMASAVALAAERSARENRLVALSELR